MVYNIFLLYFFPRSILNELMKCILSEEIKGIFSLTATVCIVVIIKGQLKHFCPFSIFLFMYYIEIHSSVHTSRRVKIQFNI